MDYKVNIMYSKRKDLALSLTQKLEIINKIKNGLNRHTILKDYDIQSSTIYNIKEDKLQKFM